MVVRSDELSSSQGSYFDHFPLSPTIPSVPRVLVSSYRGCLGRIKRSLARSLATASPCVVGQTRISTSEAVTISHRRWMRGASQRGLINVLLFILTLFRHFCSISLKAKFIVFTVNLTDFFVNFFVDYMLNWITLSTIIPWEKRDNDRNLRLCVTSSPKRLNLANFLSEHFVDIVLFWYLNLPQPK